MLPYRDRLDCRSSCRVEAGTSLHRILSLPKPPLESKIGTIVLLHPHQDLKYVSSQHAEIITVAVKSGWGFVSPICGSMVQFLDVLSWVRAQLWSNKIIIGLGIKFFEVLKYLKESNQDLRLGPDYLFHYDPTSERWWHSTNQPHVTDLNHYISLIHDEILRSKDLGWAPDHPFMERLKVLNPKSHKICDLSSSGMFGPNQNSNPETPIYTISGWMNSRVTDAVNLTGLSIMTIIGPWRDIPIVTLKAALRNWTDFIQKKSLNLDKSTSGAPTPRWSFVKEGPSVGGIYVIPTPSSRWTEGYYSLPLPVKLHRTGLGFSGLDSSELLFEVVQSQRDQHRGKATYRWKKIDLPCGLVNGCVEMSLVDDLNRIRQGMQDSSSGWEGVIQLEGRVGIWGMPRLRIRMGSPSTDHRQISRTPPLGPTDSPLTVNFRSLSQNVNAPPSTETMDAVTGTGHSITTQVTGTGHSITTQVAGSGGLATTDVPCTGVHDSTQMGGLPLNIPLSEVSPLDTGVLNPIKSRVNSHKTVGISAFENYTKSGSTLRLPESSSLQSTTSAPSNLSAETSSHCEDKFLGTGAPETYSLCAQLYTSLGELVSYGYCNPQYPGVIDLDLRPVFLPPIIGANEKTTYQDRTTQSNPGLRTRSFVTDPHLHTLHLFLSQSWLPTLGPGSNRSVMCLRDVLLELPLIVKDDCKRSNIILSDDNIAIPLSQHTHQVENQPWTFDINPSYNIGNDLGTSRSEAKVSIDKSNESSRETDTAPPDTLRGFLKASFDRNGDCHVQLQDTWNQDWLKSDLTVSQERINITLQSSHSSISANIVTSVSKSESL
jgi:hypothetical protein